MNSTANQTAQPTKGPWHIGLRTAHSNRDVYGPLGELVALADAVFTDLATAQSNARLIAASPTMLEALKAAEHALEPLVQSTDYQAYRHAYDLIQAAIATAEGGRP